MSLVAHFRSGREEERESAKLKVFFVSWSAGMIISQNEGKEEKVKNVSR